MGDRLKYFRIEALELVERLHGELLAHERGERGVEPILRTAHTLKGAARVVGQSAIAEAVHALEDAFASPLPLAEAFGRFDALAALIAGVTRAVPPAERGEAPADEAFSIVRVPLASMDALREDLAAAALQLGALERQLGRLAELRPLVAALAATPAPGEARTREAAEAIGRAIERARRELTAGVERAALEVASAASRADELRLVPVRQVFTQLERAARDAATTAGKAVTIEATGLDTRLDGPVLLQVRDALMHLMANAVAHGIEAPEARQAAGKPEAGRVRLHAARQGARVVFTCEDDGAGLDADAIRRAAGGESLAPEGVAGLSDAEAHALIFQAGLTTAARVDGLAGRGVGLDAVQAIVDGLKGTLELESTPGRGVTFTLSAPLSLSAVSALLVEADGQTCALPLEAVVRAARLDASELAVSGGRRLGRIEGREAPVVSLAEALGARPRVRVGGAVVLVRDRRREAIVAVDRLLGVTEAIVRPLPAVVGALPLLAGAALDAEGHPLPVLDAAGLVAAAHGPVAAPPEAPAVPAPVLVVDDSLTTRMLEQSILEGAGYRVMVAASGEEGLRLARDTRFALFIVDVEMPGMTGFEFVEAVRRDPALAEIPAMMVTSRHGEADRRRGEAAGAQAYMVKREFDQSRFLDTVRRLAR